jgi:chemotaxis signal transduction protein
MSANVTNLLPPVVGTASNELERRFILTQVELLTLVLPATWVTEIIRIDRSQILDLPFYDPLMVGITNRNGRIVPLIATERLLEVVPRSLPERVVVVLLEDRGDRDLGNIGLIVDRAIGSIRREELPPALFTNNRTESMVMLRSDLVPPHIWHPKYWSIDN